jgi:hypothetical protein
MQRFAGPRQNGAMGIIEETKRCPIILGTLLGQRLVIDCFTSLFDHSFVCTVQYTTVLLCVNDSWHIRLVRE